MRLNNIRNFHGVIFDKMGIEQGEYEIRVERLIEKYVALSEEVNKDEEERFKKELFKLKTVRTN